MLPAYNPVLTLELQTMSYRLKPAVDERKCSKCNLNEIGDTYLDILMMTEENIANVRYPNTMLFMQLCVNLIVRNLSKIIKFSLSHYDTNLPVYNLPFGLYPTTHNLDYCMYMYVLPHIILYCVLSVMK